jgi:hypothetical protein
VSYVATALALVGQDFLSALVVAVLVLGPGWLLAWGVAKRLAWPVAAVPPLALAFVTAGAGVASLACLALGTGLVVAIVVYLALMVAASVVGYLVGRGAPRPEMGRAGLITGGVAALVAGVVGPYMGLTADTFYHLAAVNSLLARNAVAVTDPLYGQTIAKLDPASGAWHPLLAMVSKLTTITPDWLWGGLTVVAAACLVMGFFELLRRISGSSRAAAVATTGWVLFALYADFRPAGFPKWGSLALVFIAWCAFIELREKPSLVAGAVAVLAGFAACAAHLGSAQLLVLGVAAIWVWAALDLLAQRIRREPVGWRPFGALTAASAVLALGAAAVVLPKLATLSSGPGLVDVSRASIDGSLLHWPLGVVTAKPGAFMGGGPVLSVLLIAIVLIAAWRLFGPAREKAAFGVLAIASLPLLTIYDPLIATMLARSSSYVLDRIGALLIFTPYVAIAWALGRDGNETLARVTRWLAYAALVAALVVGAVPLASTFVKLQERRGNRYPVYVSRLIDVRVDWGPGVGRLRDAVGDRYPVVAGDPVTTFYAAGLARLSVVAAMKTHPSYVIEYQSGDARRADMARLLAAGTSETDRAAVLSRWKADYVLLWVKDRPVEQAAYTELSSSPLLSQVFGPDDNGGLALFAVRK